MGQPGSDLILRGEVKERFPFGVECKNVESLNIWKALEQAGQYGEPLVFFTRNRTKEYVALSAETFLNIYKQSLKEE